MMGIYTHSPQSDVNLLYEPMANHAVKKISSIMSCVLMQRSLHNTHRSTLTRKLGVCTFDDYGGSLQGCFLVGGKVMSRLL